MSTANPSPSFACQVFRAGDVTVTSGANLGDPVGASDAVCAGDVYQIARNAELLSLQLSQPKGQGQGRITVQTIAPGSQIGAAGASVALSTRLTMMAPDGDTVDLLILRIDADGEAEYFAMPLGPMAHRTEYTLIRVEDDPTDVRLSDIVCVSFVRGTMITMADGQQREIGQLAVGDRVLTRDHGPQHLRWIGRATLRALGNFAPVVISAGTLGNAGDLIVSQHHRLFMYHRNRPTGVKTAELLVQAKHLVDGEVVFLRTGGFVDYFTLVFDRHEIIYAEGIPAESLMVTDGILARLPESLADEVRMRFPGVNQVQHYGTEAGREALEGLRNREPRR